MKQWMFVAAGLLWLGVLGGGMSATWRYENAPGLDPGRAPAEWPAVSRIPRAPGRASLVMIVHPHCPCSRASLGELALVMTHAQGLSTAHVMFYKPTGVGDDWHATDSWHAAAAIPGVTVSVDEGGVEQQRFGVATSGHTLLYDGAGLLRFSGGITAARGHSGDNAGRTAIVSLLRGTPAARHSTFVFGCSLIELDRCPGCRSAAELSTD